MSDEEKLADELAKPQWHRTFEKQMKNFATFAIGMITAAFLKDAMMRSAEPYAKSLTSRWVIALVIVGFAAGLFALVSYIDPYD
jgi:predicted membrane protein